MNKFSVKVCYLLLGLLIVVNGQDFTSDRFQNAQFHVFLTPTDFNSANTQCGAIGGTLASVRSQAEFDFLIEFYTANSISDLLFVGLSRQAADDGRDPLSFDFVDGSGDKSFIQSRDELPWSPNEPSGNNGEQCVIWHIPGSPFIDSNRWDDVPCTLPFAFLCRTDFEPEEEEEGGEFPLEFILFGVGGLAGCAALMILVILVVKSKSRASRVKQVSLFQSKEGVNQSKLSGLEYLPQAQPYMAFGEANSGYDNHTLLSAGTASDNGLTQFPGSAVTKPDDGFGRFPQGATMHRDGESDLHSGPSRFTLASLPPPSEYSPQF